MRIIWAILIVVFGAELYCATHTESIHNTKIRLSTSDQNLSRNLSRYVDRCSRRVDDILECGEPHQRYVVICQKNCAKGKPRELEYRFDDNIDMFCLTSGIMRVLLLRRSREMFGAVASGPALDFLAAGIAYSFMMRMRLEGAFTDYDYQPALCQLESGFTPNAKDLLCHPMSTEMPWLHRLYAMHSCLLMGCFRSIKVNVPRMMLEASSKGIGIDDIVEECICRQLPDGAQLQLWYENLSQQLIHHDRNSTIMSRLDEKIAELETVSVVEAGNLIAELKPVKIDTSKESIEALRGDKVLLYKRQQEFLRLRNEAPLLLRPSLEKYSKAMGYLAADDVRSFKRQLRSARNEYRTAVKKQERVEKALIEFEKEHTTPVRRYGTELEIIRRFQDLEEQLR